jgi:hypothetical protein
MQLTTRSGRSGPSRPHLPQVERRAVWCPPAATTPRSQGRDGNQPAAPEIMINPLNIKTKLPEAGLGSELPSALSQETQALRIVIEQAVALSFDIEPELLSFPSRGRARTALARQVSMYVAHVSLCFSLTQVGQLFDRDRTTVAHACEVVEQRRDDVAFDRAIELLERIVRIMCGTPGRPTGVPHPAPAVAVAS